MDACTLRVRRKWVSAIDGDPPAGVEGQAEGGEGRRDRAGRRESGSNRHPPRHRGDASPPREAVGRGPGGGNWRLRCRPTRELHRKYSILSSPGTPARTQQLKKSHNSYIYQNSVLVAAGGVAFAALWNVLLVHRPAELRSSGVAAWWTVLCAVAVINACGWHRTAQRVARQSATADALVGRFRKRQLWLSAVFVLGCGFRSLIPRADMQRFGLIDSWLSSALIGRSVATAAELCFVAQWALLLHAAARGVGSRFGVAVAWLLVPLIAVAEVCSWSAVLTTCYLGNVAEESLWALAASLLVAAGLIVWARRRPARAVLGRGAGAGHPLYYFYAIL